MIHLQPGVCPSVHCQIVEFMSSWDFSCQLKTFCSFYLWGRRFLMLSSTLHSNRSLLTKPPPWIHHNRRLLFTKSRPFSECCFYLSDTLVEADPSGSLLLHVFLLFCICTILAFETRYMLRQDTCWEKLHFISHSQQKDYLSATLLLGRQVHHASILAIFEKASLHPWPLTLWGWLWGYSWVGWLVLNPPWVRC